MSKTFTSKPSVSQSRGRGTRQNQPTGRGTTVGRGAQSSVPARGRGRTLPNPAPGRGRPPDVMDHTQPRGVGRGGDQRNSDIGQEVPQRMSHQGAYTVISPNEKKRQAINEQAKQEEAAYKAHKERQKVTHVNYVGTVGGGEMTMQDSRNKVAEQHRTSKFDRLQRQQEVKMKSRQEEQKEANMKKQQQRAKAERNVERELLTSADQKRRWDLDRKRKNEEFLKRFEKSTPVRSPPETQVRSNEAGSQGVSTSSRLQGPPEPRGVGTERVPQSYRSSTDDNHSRTGDMENNRSYVHGASNYRTQNVAGHPYDDDDPALVTLKEMFPGYGEEFLKDLLLQNGGNAEAAAQQLL